MRNTYTVQLAARCPVDGSRDLYTLEVVAHREIRVEDTIEALAEPLEPITQEAWTLLLAERLRASVRLKGTHSGVHVVTEAP